MSKLLLSSAAKNESSNLIRSAASKGENGIGAHGDLGSYLHPVIAARLEMSAIIRPSRFDGNIKLGVPSKADQQLITEGIIRELIAKKIIPRDF